MICVARNLTRARVVLLSLARARLISLVPTQGPYLSPCPPLIYIELNFKLNLRLASPFNEFKSDPMYVYAFTKYYKGSENNLTKKRLHT